MSTSNGIHASMFEAFKVLLIWAGKKFLSVAMRSEKSKLNLNKLRNLS